MTAGRLSPYEPVVRQICGVDFVFPDYKEPLVQLRGLPDRPDLVPVEGYKRGTLPYALADGRLSCAFCDPSKRRPNGRVTLSSGWHVLAPHLRTAHGMTPQEYRDRIGLLRKTRLVSASHHARAHKSALGVQARTEFWLHSRDRGQPTDGRGVPEDLNKRGVCRDQLIAVTKKVAKDNGGKVRKADLHRQGVWDTSIRRFFPSMRVLCAEAGVAYAGKPEWTDVEMLRAFRELAERLGRTPTQEELGGANRTPSNCTYQARFGGLNEVCRLLGLPSNSPRPITFGDEIDILNRYAQGATMNAVALATHRQRSAISQVFARYGVPVYAPGGGHEAERRKARAWAAEIAQRLAS